MLGVIRAPIQKPKIHRSRQPGTIEVPTIFASISRKWKCRPIAYSNVCSNAGQTMTNMSTNVAPTADQLINRADLQGDERRSITLKLNQGDARKLARLLAVMTDELESQAIGSSPTVVSSFTREALIKRARQLLNDRRRRTRHLGQAIFGEPAWEILLILYVEHDRRRLTVSNLTGASGVPASTVLRWLAYLDSQGLTIRSDHPTDARISYVDLTEKGLEALDSYFSETLTAAQ
jgi:DNA-binding MarR family transcriptional regulator